jgi:hypothetical protein
VTPGDVILISLPQLGGGGLKLRPALLEEIVAQTSLGKKKKKRT